MDMLDKVIALLEWDSDENTQAINALIAQSFPSWVQVLKVNSIIGEVYSLVYFDDLNTMENLITLGTAKTIEDAWLFAPDYYNDLNVLATMLDVQRPDFNVKYYTGIQGNELYSVTLKYKGVEVWHSEASMCKAIAGAWLLAWAKTDSKTTNE